MNRLLTTNADQDRSDGVVASVAVNDPIRTDFNHATSAVSDRVNPVVGNGGDGDERSVSEHVLLDEEPVNIATPLDHTSQPDGTVVDVKVESERRIAGCPWDSNFHLEFLLREGWKPTRWEHDNSAMGILEYPLAGGMRLIELDGSVSREVTPSGDLVLHGVNEVILQNVTGEAHGK